MSLMPCTAKFAAAISNPWSEMAMGACVPIGTSNTLKCTSKGVITMTLGTQGFGAVFMVPSFFRDVGGVYVTNGDYNHTFIDPQYLNDGSNTIDWHPFSRLPFAVGAEAQNVNGRVVSCGVKVTYIGSLAYRAGLYSCLTSPTHDDLSDAAGDSSVSAGSVSSFEECFTRPVSNDSVSNIIYPISDKERNFRDNQGNILGQTWSNGAFLNTTDNQDISQYYYPLHGGDYISAGNSYVIAPVNNVIIINGNPTYQYMVEYIIHVEYTGGSANFGTTPVEADVEGVLKVTEAAAKATVHSNSTGQNYAKSFMSGLIETFREANIGDSIRATTELFSLLSTSMSGSRIRSTALMN